MLVLQIDRRAEAELRKAIRDYETRDPALARRFVREYLERVRFILRFPGAGQRIPKHTSIFVQRYLMDKRYPFKLIVATRGNRMKILAVAHHGQAPDYWEDRLDDMDEDEAGEKKPPNTTKKGGETRAKKRSKR